jgi:hypothetical protein
MGFSYLVGWIVDFRTSPCTTAGSILTELVLNQWSFPFAVHFLVPVIRHYTVWVCDKCFFIIEPAVGLDRVFIRNFSRSSLIPIFRLGSVWVSNTLSLVP